MTKGEKQIWDIVSNEAHNLANMLQNRIRTMMNIDHDATKEFVEALLLTMHQVTDKPQE